MRGTTFLCTGDAAPAVTYCAGWFISLAGWAKGTQPADTGCLFLDCANAIWRRAAFIAPEIDFAVLVACNRGLDIAIWKTRQAAKALIWGFRAKLS